MTDHTAATGGSCPFPHAAAPAPAVAEGGCPAGPARRSFVRTALGAGAGAAVLAGGAFTLAAGPASAGDSRQAKSGAVPFHGDHQAGVTTPAPGYAAFVSCQVIAQDRKGLEDLLKTLTERIRFLAAGGTRPTSASALRPPTAASSAPPCPPTT